MSNEHKERGERLKALTDDQISETLGRLIDIDQAGADRLLDDVNTAKSILNGPTASPYVEGYKHARNPHNLGICPYPAGSADEELWWTGYSDATDDLIDYLMEDPERFDGMG